MNQLQQGCGATKTMGHGCFARCGEPFYNEEPWYCEECLRKRVEELEDIVKMLQGL
ncbi:putative DNA primase small subunit [Vibrio virus VPMCC5]|nr:putative DNA primase small subunit [Vibrio virus VPMCC5]